MSRDQSAKDGQSGACDAGAPETAPPSAREVFKRLILWGRRPVPLIFALIAGLIAAVVAGLAGWDAGQRNGRAELLAFQAKGKVAVPDDFFTELDRAFGDLRNRDAGSALAGFQELEASYPDVGSLSYLVALSAFRTGDIPLARSAAARSIERHEKVSDALALLALIESHEARDPARKTFGDPDMRAALTLRQAILADVTNPMPMLELSLVMRGQGRRDEALAVLRGAAARVFPVDTPGLIDISIALAELEGLPDWELPDRLPDGEDLKSAFEAAYVKMRRGDFAEAARILEAARVDADPALFRYLMNDPAIRAHRGVAQLQSLFL